MRPRFRGLVSRVSRPSPRPRGLPESQPRSAGSAPESKDSLAVRFAVPSVQQDAPSAVVRLGVGCGLGSHGGLRAALEGLRQAFQALGPSSSVNRHTAWPRVESRKIARAGLAFRTILWRNGPPLPPLAAARRAPRRAPSPPCRRVREPRGHPGRGHAHICDLVDALALAGRSRRLGRPRGGPAASGPWDWVELRAWGLPGGVEGGERSLSLHGLRSGVACTVFQRVWRPSGQEKQRSEAFAGEGLLPTATRVLAVCSLPDRRRRHVARRAAALPHPRLHLRRKGERNDQDRNPREAFAGRPRGAPEGIRRAPGSWSSFPSFNCL